MTSPNIAIYLL